MKMRHGAPIRNALRFSRSVSRVHLYATCVGRQFYCLPRSGSGGHEGREARSASVAFMTQSTSSIEVGRSLSSIRLTVVRLLHENLER